MRAIILAGGKGTRLRPYTTTIPKPLVPVGDRSILEIVVEQLRDAGFDRITITVNHLSNLVMAYFGDGKRWGINIDYSLEDSPLGTIGPLTLIDDLPENFLVMNGDILCDIDYGSFLKAHCQAGDEVTVGAFEREQRVDYGVLDCDRDGRLVGFREKPVYPFRVSMGVYCFRRDVIARLEYGRPFGFDDLMHARLEEGRSVAIRTHDGLWIDIGRPEDYDFVNENLDELLVKLSLD